MMIQKPDWTKQLGQLFATNRDAVFDSIQRLRAQAQAAGNLKSTSQQEVQIQTTSSGQQVIVIQPANPQVIYVPQYNSQVVYTSSASSTTAAVIGFTHRCNHRGLCQQALLLWSICLAWRGDVQRCLEYPIQLRERSAAESLNNASDLQQNEIREQRQGTYEQNASQRQSTAQTNQSQRQSTSQANQAQRQSSAATAQSNAQANQTAAADPVHKPIRRSDSLVRRRPNPMHKAIRLSGSPVQRRQSNAKQSGSTAIGWRQPRAIDKRSKDNDKALRAPRVLVVGKASGQRSGMSSGGFSGYGGGAGTRAESARGNSSLGSARGGGWRRSQW